jgi:hypothetical protein
VAVEHFARFLRTSKAWPFRSQLCDGTFTDSFLDQATISSEVLMYCPSCGNEISVELKYCNRCGANLSIIPTDYASPVVKPVRLGFPAIVLGLTITISFGIIFSSATELAQRQLHPAAIAWMVIFSLATLFGCTALMIRFWLKVLSMNRESHPPRNQNQVRPPMQASLPRQQFPPRLEPMPSVTEHTTRTFSPAYKEGSDPGVR